MKILVIADCSPAQIKPETWPVVTAACTFGGAVDLLIIGAQTQSLSAQAAQCPKLARVLVADDPKLAHPLAENFSRVVLSIAHNYQVILAPATSFGKNLLPRIAAKLDSQQISDVSAILSPSCFVRPIYAGNAIETVETTQPTRILTIRPTSFEAAATQGGATPIEAIAIPDLPQQSEFVSHELSASERPELGSAKIVVSGGRGLQNKENFKLVEELADRLGAAVGASRAAVDAGFVSNDCQVGQTGKVVAPDLYIALGISGAIQHLAGMKDSKIIVAINKDEEAPIFQVADYGIVGDLFKIVPDLIQELDKAGIKP